MSAFSADWLALREPFDAAARAAAAGALDLRGLAARRQTGASTLAVLDLACGTGANLRELAPRLGGAQRWTLVDHDPQLLAALPHAMAAWARAHGLSLHGGHGRLRIDGGHWSAEVETRRLDLASVPGPSLFERQGLVTASALLDLVSAPWIDALAARAGAAGAAVLLALTVDGRVEWRPGVAGDEEVHRLFAAHQGRDKGFGPALGGRAVAHASGRLAALGYAVTQAASDWWIEGADGPGAIAMLRAVVEGEAAAAFEQDPAATASIEDWLARRLASLGDTCLRIGHCELLATPP